MEGIDEGALKGSIESYVQQSQEIWDEPYLDLAEAELEQLQKEKGFSFPTNEGMRKVTKNPELDKIDIDPNLNQLAQNIRKTINGVTSSKEGGVYAGVNAFHHGHLAYLSKSEAILAVDMNKLVPYGFAFVVGLVGALKTPEDFRKQVALMATNPNLFKDFFENTDIENTVLIESDSTPAVSARKKLMEGLMSIMSEFNPFIHGQTKVPPVFCYDNDAYNYFRTLVVQDKVAGIKTKIQGRGMISALAQSIESFNPNLPELNTLYVSSCFDPRFAGPKERKKFFEVLQRNGHHNIQVVEAFLNSGWIVYDINQ